MSRLPLIALLVASLAGCSGDEQSPEEAVRAFIESAADIAEQRDTSRLLEMVDENYLDPGGQHKKQLADLLRAYFFRHKNIHLFTRIRNIDWLEDGRATVTLYVAMAGSAITSVETLDSLRAQVYRFEVGLVRKVDGRWLLLHATYEPANLLDLQ